MEAGAKTERETAMFSGLQRKYDRYMPFYVMILPGILYLVINNYLPMAGITLVFKQMNHRVGILKSPWIGFSNFEFLFRSTDAFVITRNTLLYNGMFLLLGPALGITVTIVLSEIGSRMAKKAYQAIVLVPYLISIVVVNYLVYAFLATDAGFIDNSILKPLGIEDIRWYSTKRYWPFILTIIHLWQDIGYNTIIYYSTVVGLNLTLYETTAMDDVGGWKQILCVTLPGLESTIITLTLLRVGKILCLDFRLFYQIPMDSGPLYDVTNTIGTYVYRGLTQFSSVGVSSATGFYQSVIGFLFVLTANLIIRKISKEDILLQKRGIVIW